MKRNLIPKIFVLTFVCFCGLLHYQCNSDTRPEGRFVFIDGGAHRGETIKTFKKSTLYSEHRWNIYSFECNPQVLEILRERFSQSDDVEIINKAMWIHSQGLEFYFAKSTLEGNVVKNLHTPRERKSTHVESIDFGDWLKENFKIEDTIHVKLDIEGAEYEILDKMFRDGSIRYVDKFYIEFHSAIMKDITEEKDDYLINRITKY